MKTITTITTGRKPILPSLSLRSKLSRLSIPKLGKSPTKSPNKKGSGKLNKQVSNKQVLALVTTCCLTCLVRPNMARAITFFIDPMTLTYDEVPGLGMLPNGAPGMMYNLGFIEALRRKSLGFFASVFVAASLVSWMYGGLVYWMAFLASFDQLDHLSSMENTKHAQHDDGDTMTVKDDKHFNQARHVDWDKYSQVLLGRPSQKKERATADDAAAENDVVLQKANRFFQEQKRKLHHHPVHAFRSKFESSKYLDTLALKEELRHDVPKSYLGTLSNAKICTWKEYKQHLTESRARQVEKDEVGDRLQILRNLLTWDDYKNLVSELQDKKNEVIELKEEVQHLQNLLQIEQSIHQAAPEQEPKLTMGKDRSTSDELKELEGLTQEFQMTIEEALDLEDQLQDDFHLGSGIK